MVVPFVMGFGMLQVEFINAPINKCMGVTYLRRTFDKFEFLQVGTDMGDCVKDIEVLW